MLLLNENKLNSFLEYYELSRLDTITHSKSFPDIQNIFSSLNKKDKLYVTAVSYTDNPATIYRDVIKINDHPASFVNVIDLYKMYKEEQYKGIGHVTVATKDKYRGQKLSYMICREMLENLAFDRSRTVNILRWRCKSDNIKSKKLAERLGFKYKETDSEDKCVYYLDLNTIKERKLTI